MKYICVCTLQRGVLDPPEPLTEAESFWLEQQEEAIRLAAECLDWQQRCDFKTREE